MRLRSSTRPKPWTWQTFPGEIRLMILETITHQKHPGWASLASVCKEWQFVIEKANFYKIKVGAPCLDDFARIASGQKRDLIHHICLNIELPRYDSPRPERPQNDLESALEAAFRAARPSTSVETGKIASDGIWKLWCILSTWKAAEDLALEININSQSDCEYWFTNIDMSSDDVEDDGCATSDATRSLYHDPQHGWMHGQQVEAPPITAVERLFSIICLHFRDSLPPIKAVTSLIIRRQLRRCVSPDTLSLLLTTLVRLKNLVYEPWMPCHQVERRRRNDGRSLVLQQLPKTLNSLVLFEDSYEFPSPFLRELGRQIFLGRHPNQIFSAALASKSLGLEHLAISFMVGADDLFENCQATWSWPHLRSLALTSQILQGDYDRETITSLLCRASVFAQKMPKLHTFVLWNDGEAHACAFIYRTDGERASVTWRGTWSLDLDPRVVTSWQQVGSTPRFPELRVSKELISDDIKSHGDALYHLKLPCQVIDPASLWQMRREGHNLT